MKKLFTIVLCMCMLAVCFAGCGSEPAAKGDPLAGKFCVGYSKVDITPSEKVNMAGFADLGERVSTTIMDHIYATCIAFTDEDGTTVLMFGLDMLNTAENNANAIRKLIREVYPEIPEENIVFSATHTHSSMDPGIAGVTGDKFRQNCLQAAQEAMADRKPAQMQAAFGRPEGLNWRRHFILTDGSYRAYQLGLIDQNLIYGHLGQADNLMQLIKFTREGGKDVVLINWQAHYAGATGIDYTGISADYPGVMRSEVERLLDCHAAFVLGGAGNLVCGSRMTNTYIFDNYNYDSYVTHGQLLAAEAAKFAENFQPAQTGKIFVTKEDYVMTAERKHPLYAFGFGEFACTFAPFEIFDMHAREVREASPYKYTFYASCANAGNGGKYMPHEESFNYFCYEAEANLYGKGASEILRDQMMDMMDKTFAASGQAAQEKAEGYMSTPYEPKANGISYMNPAPGSLPVVDCENDYWGLDLLYNGQIVRILLRDKALAEQVINMPSVQFLFDDYNVAVAIVK